MVDGGPDSAVELGVKFQSDVAGTITGIRFYKAAANTGTHIGNLWTSSGTLLATVTFTNETASGWQQVLFATPVAIASNTVYVASYHANNGHYSADVNYFSGKRRGQSAPARADQWRVGRQWCLCLRREQRLPQPDLECRQLLGGCGVPGWASANPDVHCGDAGESEHLDRSLAAVHGDGNLLGREHAEISPARRRGPRRTRRWRRSTPSGLATGVSAGTTTISAALAGVTGSTTLTVQSAPLAITTTSLPNGVVNMAYSATLTASGGTLPYTWSIASGSLPSGPDAQRQQRSHHRNADRRGDFQLHRPGEGCRQSRTDRDQGAEHYHCVCADGGDHLAEHDGARTWWTAARTARWSWG